ncbi:MAG: hypothetical protein R3F59_24310 [Myxococcota bacterium]
MTWLLLGALACRSDCLGPDCDVVPTVPWTPARSIPTARSTATTTTTSSRPRPPTTAPS